MASIGIIGCGQVVSNYYLPALEAWGVHDEILLYDKAPERVKQLCKLFKAKVATVEEIKNSCEHLLIASPPSSHAYWLRELLRPGKSILCEKPLLLEEKQLQDILPQAEAKNCRLYAGHIRRLFPQVKEARQLLADKTLSIQKIEIFEGGRFNYPAVSSYPYTDTMGGVLADTGSHALDTALYVCALSGKDLRISVQHMMREQAEPAHATDTSFILHAEKDIPLRMVLSRYESMANVIRIYTSEFVLEIPAGIQPMLRLKNKKSEIVHCSQPPLNIHEAFQLELKEVFEKQNESLLGARQFILLTRMLEAAYKA